MASGSPGGNWKHGAAGGNRAQPARGTSRRAWQPGAARPEAPAGGRRSRTGRFVLAGLAAGLLLALIVVVIEMIKPPRYPSLVVVGPNAAGSLALPENVGGQNAANAITNWAREGRRDRPRSAATPAEVADRDAWKARLDRDARSVVLYFAAHGGADPKGPFLWVVPADARAPADAHKLHVRDILERLGELPRDQPKLVIFDATAAPASWVHGALSNDFARALKELDDEIAKVGGLAVICASDDDQRSWVSEEWRQSVFAHFLLEGLKGAAGRPGDRITADAVFDYVAREVDRWAVANRDERQAPVLLPKDEGRGRAAKLELAAVPAAGYQPPPTPPAPGEVPADLKAAWETAGNLANLVPSPDTVDPARWREYLDLLVRWDRLVRMGEEDLEPVRGRVRVLADRLRDGPGLTDPPCLSAALPVGRALGFPPAERNLKAFGRLWDPPMGVTRPAEWAEQLGPERKNEPARVVAAADLALARVDSDRPTPEVLTTADDVLRVVSGTWVTPAEAHYVRMLKQHLHPDPQKRPRPELLQAAVRLRVRAEKVAWVGGIEDRYPYPEQVFRWVRGHVEAGDAARELGQDCLFDTAEKSWAAAEREHFPAAHRHYDQACKDAAVVAAALATRDRVLARLPYYARWVAADRGKLPPAEAERLLAAVEAAARAAHRIADRAAEVPADTAPRLKELEAAAAEADREFGVVVKAFEAELAGLTNVVHPSNWHALDNALSVPFIPAQDRVKLLRYARDVSYQLATKSEPAGATAPGVPAQELARRQGRMALAVLGGPTHEVRQLIDLPKPGAWWESFRDAGDRVGKRFRGLPDEARAATGRADATPELRAAAPHLGRAAYLARLADPAAPVVGFDPPAAEQRYWRHYLLLWQAERAIAAGWADVAVGPPDQWYCRKAAKAYVDTARGLVLGSDPNLSPEEAARRLADSQAAEKLGPVVLDLTAPAKQEVADEPRWRFGFAVTPRGDRRAGLPVYWLDRQGLPFTAQHPALDGRALETRLPDGKKADVSFQFTAAPGPKDGTAPDGAGPGELTTTVLYRGHPYRQVTEVHLAGTPTLDWRYAPPKGDAAFAVLADKGMVTGAVVVLIDLSESMNHPVPGTKRTKIEEVFQGLEAVLADLAPNTTLTVATFWGDKTNIYVEPVKGATKVLWRAEAVQTDAVMRAIKALVPKPGGNTPLAHSVTQILSKDGGARFWPAKASGTRTLVVLTDGKDNWSKGEAGSVVLKALLDTTKEETAFHLVFFAMTPDEEQTAADQFKVLTNRVLFEEAGRPVPQRWPKIRDARALSNSLRQAMLPRVYYRRQDLRGGRGPALPLPVTLPGEGQFRPSGPLTAPGVYDLWGLSTLQKLRVDPGDRVLMRARRVGDGLELYIPPFAFETAQGLTAPGLVRPAATSGDGKNGVHLTIPELTTDENVRSYDLNLVATLERVGGSPPGEFQSVPRPLFPWFEVTYADGQPAPPGLRRGLRVVNRPGLVAPAWDLKATQWDANRNRKAVRRPEVSAYWAEGLSDPVGRIPVDLGDPGGTAARVPKVGGVEVVDVGYEDVTGPDAGKYLVVWLRHPKGQPVFIRPVRLKGTEQRFQLAERHLYFEGLDRYTARFGPLTPDDLKGSAELEVYAVEELKDRARKTGGAATYRFAPDRDLETYYVPNLLNRLEPKKE